MMREDEEGTLTDGEDAAFVERIAGAYAPEPMTAEARVAFNRTLEARLERPRRRWLAPAVAMAAALACAWIVWPGLRGAPVPEPAATAVLAELREGDAAEAESWERELFYPDELAGAGSDSESEQLPDEYLAIASVFLDV